MTRHPNYTDLECSTSIGSCGPTKADLWQTGRLRQPIYLDILSSLMTCTVNVNALEPPAPHDKINPRARSLDVLTVGE